MTVNKHIFLGLLFSSTMYGAGQLAAWLKRKCLYSFAKVNKKWNIGLPPTICKLPYFWCRILEPCTCRLNSGARFSLYKRIGPFRGIMINLFRMQLGLARSSFWSDRNRQFLFLGPRPLSSAGLYKLEQSGGGVKPVCVVYDILRAVDQSSTKVFGWRHCRAHMASVFTAQDLLEVESCLRFGWQWKCFVNLRNVLRRYCVSVRLSLSTISCFWRLYDNNSFNPIIPTIAQNLSGFCFHLFHGIIIFSMMTYSYRPMKSFSNNQYSMPEHFAYTFWGDKSNRTESIHSAVDMWRRSIWIRVLRKVR